MGNGGGRRRDEQREGREGEEREVKKSEGPLHPSQEKNNSHDTLSFCFSLCL